MIKGLVLVTGVHGIADVGVKNKDGNYDLEKFIFVNVANTDNSNINLSFSSPTFLGTSQRYIDAEMPPSSIMFFFEVEKGLESQYKEYTSSIQVVSSIN